MDSPGHCAQYCTYTLMEHESKDVLAMVTVDKRETGLKSANMERKAFLKALEQVEEPGVEVVEVVTDGHIQIAAEMRGKCNNFKFVSVFP